MRRIALPSTLVAIAALAASPLQAKELPGWMAGCWIAEEGESWSEECWTVPRAGTMMGSARSGLGDNLYFWEVMRLIENDEDEDGPSVDLALWVSPLGNVDVRFNWRATPEEEGVSFFNASNDYPQRIHYWRDGEMLRAEISMEDGSKVKSWSFRPMSGGGTEQGGQ